MRCLGRLPKEGNSVPAERKECPRTRWPRGHLDPHRIGRIRHIPLSSLQHGVPFRVEPVSPTPPLAVGGVAAWRSGPAGHPRPPFRAGKEHFRARGLVGTNTGQDRERTAREALARGLAAVTGSSEKLWGSNGK